MITLKTKREVEILREANGIVADVLATLAEMVVPGVTTAEMDAVAEDLIRNAGGKPSFCRSLPEKRRGSLAGSRRRKG